MPVAVQKYIMARILAKGQDGFRAATENETMTMSKTGEHTKTGTMATLRSLAREQYWLDMSKSERAEAREAANSQDANSDLEPSVAVVEANWNAKWNNGRGDPDYFRNYLVDQTAATKLWPLVDEDIFIVTDKNRRVVFANIENLSQILFGDEVTQLMDRAIDLWSFYHPLPQPETSRHVVDRYVRRKHPELDPSKCTVETCRTQRWLWPTTDAGPSRVIGTESLFVKRRILEASKPIIQSFSASCFNDLQRPCWERRRNSSGFLPSHWMTSTARSVSRYSRTCPT